MSEQNAIQIWGAEQAESSVPDFLRQAEPKGFDDVKPPVTTSQYRLAQALSEVVTEKKVEVGTFYESSDQESLGDTRVITIFKTRRVRQLMNPEGKSVACKAYKLNEKGFGTGHIRLFNHEDMPKEYLRKWGITEDEIEEKRVKSQDCASCPFAEWTTDDEGKNIPPKCKHVYELYFLDATNLPTSGEIDPIPHQYDIVESNAATRQAIRDLDTQITRKIRQQGVPIWGGFFKMSAYLAENSTKAKFYAPRFDFIRLMNQGEKEIADLAEILFEELTRRQDEIDQGDMMMNRSVDDTGSETPAAPAMDVQEGGLSSTPWGSETAATSEAEAKPEEPAAPTNSTPWD